MTATPEPGEIAETIIAEFYKKWNERQKSAIQIERDRGYGSTTLMHIRWDWERNRLEEMLKRVWFLLLEEKAERGGFDV